MTQYISQPNISCYITPPNGVATDYAKYIDYNGSLSITQNFGRQGDTASIVLIDPNYSYGVPPNVTVTPSFIISAYSLIKIVDNSLGETLFAGYVSSPAFTIESPTQAKWTLSCVDYSGYANASICQYTFEGVSMGTAIVDLVAKANCGIKAALVSNGGYIQPGPIIPRTVIHYTNLTQGLQRISKMASSSSAYGWYVDENLNLHFYDQNQADHSGVTVTDMPSAASGYPLSTTEAHIVQDGSLSYEFDGTTLFNRALVVGAKRTIPANTKLAPTNSWVANGSGAGWQLSYVPYGNGSPKLTVNGVTTTVGIYDGSAKLTTQYGIYQNSNGTWTLKANPPYGSVPASGTLIKIWYEYQLTVTAQVDLKQSQKAIGGPNHGVFATVVNQPSLQTTTAAYQRGTRELAEYGHPQERISFSTSPEFVGIIRAGQTFKLKSTFLLDSQTNFTPGLNATFMVTQQTINFGQGGFRTCQIQAVRVL